MRAGIATIQQTLTPEAAAVLKRAIADAQRRGHAQVTPLHVASSLLASPSSMLQQACIQSHRHVPHPLHCRALELCFNVALERLPATIIQQQQQQSSSQISSKSQQNQASSDQAGSSSPSSCSSGTATLSNALVAALKRAQAHQRRGCPEQQQVPLLAVKVEMEQLVISILDDPSVSRVMREAGFSSTRAKNSLEAVCSSSSAVSSPSPLIANSSSRPAGSSQSPQQMINPEEIRLRMQQQNHQHQALLLNHGNNAATIDAAMGILSRRKKQRNPVLIGEDSLTGSAVRDLLARLEQQRMDHLDCFKGGVRVLGVERGFGSSREISEKSMIEIARAQERCLQDQIPVVVFLGNLAWCSEQHGGAMLGELAAVLARCERLWFVGIASSASYMRFLAQFPTMESSLGLQPLPLPSSSAMSSIRPRFSLVEKPLESFPRLPKMPFKLPDDHQSWEEQQQLTCCADCTAKFEQESSLLLQEQQIQQGFSKTESVQSNSGESLPFWMKNRKSATEPRTQDYPQLIRELRRKWSRNCQNNSHPLRRGSPPSSSLPNLIDSHSSSSQTSSPDGAAKSAPSPSPPPIAQVNMVNPQVNTVNDPRSSSSSSSWLSLSTLTEEAALTTPQPSLSLGLTVERNATNSGRVATDLALGTPNPLERSAMKVHRERIEAANANANSQRAASISGRGNSVVVDFGGMFKNICRRLCDRVPWQGEQIAGKIASAIVQCRSGEKRRGMNVRGDAWMLFSGGDFMAKRKVAKILAGLVFQDEEKMVLLSLKNNRVADHCDHRRIRKRSCWEDDTSGVVGFRGKTVVDRIAEAVKLKPFSVVLLEDFDQADVSVRKALIRTMERGKIQHSSGREVSLSNTVVILTASAAIAGKNNNNGSRVEEKLGAVEGGEVLVRMQSRTEDFGRSGCEVRIVEGESVLAREEVSRVGEKRKDRTNCWGERLESLLGFNTRKKNLALDLNLGLGSVWEEDQSQACDQNTQNIAGISEAEQRIFDEVVSFRDLELDSIARPVMESLEGLAARFGGCVEVDLKALELMLARVWEEPNGGESLQRWLKQSVESKILGGDFVLVRLVGTGGDESAKTAAVAAAGDQDGAGAEIRLVPQEQASINRTSLTLFGGIEVGS